MSLAVLMMVVNAILFVVGLAGSSAIILSMKQNYNLNYGAFLRVYQSVALLDFLLILFIAPVFTAGSISGERERGTYDLLLTTNLSTTDILLEKLAAAAVSMGMVVVSALPALLIPLMFGGVHIQSVIFLLLIMLAESFLILSIGMFASCIGTTGVKSLAIAYALTAGITIGPFLIVMAFGAFTPPGQNHAVALFAIDPLLPAAAALFEQVGEVQMLEKIFRAFGGSPDPGFLRHAALISILLQMAMSFGFVMCSLIYLMPQKSLLRFRRRKVEKEESRMYN